MTPAALRGITHPNPEPGPANQTPSRGELCPDVLAVAGFGRGVYVGVDGGMAGGGR